MSHPMLLGSSVYPLDPQRPELPLLSLAVLELILHGLLNPLPCHSDAVLASSPAERWEWVSADAKRILEL